MWVYSCYLAPSLSTTDFSHALDTIAFDARGRYPAIIAGDFNASAEEWGCPSSNIRRLTLLNAFATLDVALLNEGTQETFNRAGAGSITYLTFVSSALARRSHWRIGDFFTASEDEATMHSGHTARTRNPEQSSQGLPPGDAKRQGDEQVPRLRH